MEDLSTLSDEALAARAGESGAHTQCFEELYRRHLPRVLGWCLRIVHDEDEAEDVAQDVFLLVHRELTRFRGDSRFTTWLYVVARRAAIDRLRRNRGHAEKIALVQQEPGPESKGPAAELESRESAETLRALLLRVLEPREAQAIYMHYTLGMTLPAITRFLSLTNASGAKALVVAAMRKLRRHYGITAGGRG